MAPYLRTIFTLTLAIALAGCSTPFRSGGGDEMIADFNRAVEVNRERRRKGYERLTQLIEPGMTRRQLYALLPPKKVLATAGHDVFDLPPAPPSQQELHYLDSEFRLRVFYTLADPGHDIVPSKRLTTAEILSYTWEPRVVWQKSKENPDDVLSGRPAVERIRERDAPE